MHMLSKYWLLFLVLSLFLSLAIVKGSENDERKVYIVYMGELPEETTSLIDDHHQLLVDAIGHEETAIESRIYSYSRSFNGFAAKLLPQEADRLAQNENVVSVFPSVERKLSTTRSWDFLGVPLTVKRNVAVESNTIVGVIDSGIYIDSKSFNDKGYGPPPAKWKGKCETGLNFTGCNNKVIGARSFILEGHPTKEDQSPADFYGHGTHTSSTVGGLPVEHSSLYGLAAGTAHGGVPHARIAMYKACRSQGGESAGCLEYALLAAFDAAIADGVDIISVSIGGPYYSYFEDPIAIGSFHAVKKGIFVACSAGNAGPRLQKVENGAPWITTVAASSLDRAFATPVKLGNGQTFHGNALNFGHPMRKMYPLVSGAQAGNRTAHDVDSITCGRGSLNKTEVQGKIVFCRHNNVRPEGYVKTVGGIGTIETAYEQMDVPLINWATQASVTVVDGDQIDRYINSNKNPTAIIFKSREIRSKNAESIASFSSRGPVFMSDKFLKPDIAAPGNNILAAVTRLNTLRWLSQDPHDRRVVDYALVSGTSMACPHVAAAAAYVKTFHPNWSPAAIRSALMTTAKPIRIKPEGGEIASGAGNIHPVRAVDPGLVYDMDENSYISFLCQEGYNESLIALLAGKNARHCSDLPNHYGHDGLNYPSIYYQLKQDDYVDNTDISGVYKRTVTHVGEGKSEYKVKVKSPRGLSIKVEPETLVFHEKGQKGSFKVTIKGKFLNTDQWYFSGSIVWTDSTHHVKSPVYVYKPHYIQYN